MEFCCVNNFVTYLYNLKKIYSNFYLQKKKELIFYLFTKKAYWKFLLVLKYYYLSRCFKIFNLLIRFVLLYILFILLVLPTVFVVALYTVDLNDDFICKLTYIMIYLTLTVNTSLWQGCQCAKVSTLVLFQ